MQRVLQPAYYREDKTYQIELNSIFPQGWNLIARTEDFLEAGAYRACHLGKENVFILRSKNGNLRGFLNHCKHRAGPLVKEEYGTLKSLSCRYHGWTYNENGQLIAAPDFDISQCEPIQLTPLQIAEWGPLVFASIRPIASFEDYMSEILSESKEVKLSEMKWRRTKDYRVKCNWKIYVDNYLEGYHLPIVHPGLNRELDFKRYEVKARKWHSRQFAPTKPAARHYIEGQDPTALYYWIWPNCMLNIYQGIMQTNLVIPCGPHECIVRFEWYTTDEVDEERLDELQQFSDEIQKEDEDICHWVERNLASNYYKPGPYVMKHESALFHFHELVRQFVES